jgi:mannose-6-phosphate isomerase-like protein (cupin superfamily)
LFGNQVLSKSKGATGRPEKEEMEMRLGNLVFALFAVIVAPSEATAITTYSSSPSRTIIATATVPDRNNVPLYFSILSGSGKLDGVASGDEVFYQSTGTAEIKRRGRNTLLPIGSGMFLPSGTAFTVNARDAGPLSTYLQFVLSSAPRSFDKLSGNTIEIYRSPSPISGLMQERDRLSLIRVMVPPQAPCDPLHRRAGAALHYVLSGTGAEFMENRAISRGLGSVSYEPNELLYQWSNPGSTPLIYLLLNVNPEGGPAVVGATEEQKDPFSGNSHLTWAIYCVGFSIILTVLISARLSMDNDHGWRPGSRG